jgi:male germ cell-associated kinase
VVAIKILFAKIGWSEATNLREIKSLKELSNHPNVIKIKEMALRDEKLHVVFEFCEQNLL